MADRLCRAECIMIMILMMDLCVCVLAFSGRCLTSHCVSQPKTICSASARAQHTQAYTRERNATWLYIQKDV